jgi:hypothetical protein
MADRKWRAAEVRGHKLHLAMFNLQSLFGWLMRSTLFPPLTT